jgi:hypothetical protein
MTLVMVTVTGSFPNAIGQDATVTFTPSADLDDPADAEFVAQVPDPVNFGASGTFSQALISNLANPQILPAGWTWNAVITIGNRSGMFPFNVPGTGPVDISALMPPGFQL